MVPLRCLSVSRSSDRQSSDCRAPACASRLDLPIVHATTVSAPEQGGAGAVPPPRHMQKENRMTRFLVRGFSVALALALLAVGAWRADARDEDDRDNESRNMKLVGFNDLQARSTYQ